MEVAEVLRATRARVIVTSCMFAAGSGMHRKGKHAAVAIRALSRCAFFSSTVSLVRPKTG